MCGRALCSVCVWSALCVCVDVRFVERVCVDVRFVERALCVCVWTCAL